MQRVVRSVIAGAVIAALSCLPSRVQAQRAVLQITTMYMTTQAAYVVFGSGHSLPPPKVTAFPVGVSDVGVYFDYSNGKLKTSYRVGFFHGGTEVRHGAEHSFDDTASGIVLSIPAQELQAVGAYKATLYVNEVAVKTIGFTVINTPTITSAYMITAKAWNAYQPTSSRAPAKTTSFPAGVASVGAYFSYDTMVKSDIHYIAVYDAMGKLAHRSHDSTASYVPSGDIAIILPSDAGHYAKGTYRADLYINGAMVRSIAWNSK
jgi:hypothetical protein